MFRRSGLVLQEPEFLLGQATPDPENLPGAHRERPALEQRCAARRIDPAERRARSVMPDTSATGCGPSVKWIRLFMPGPNRRPHSIERLEGYNPRIESS